MIKWAAMLTHGSQDDYNTWHGTDFHDYSGASTEKKKLQALRALNSQVTENQSSLKETLYTLFYLVATEIIFLKIKAKIQWCGL